MFLDYKIFYRKFGIRRLMEIINPRIFNFDSLSLPKNIIYHHDLELDSLGPSINETLFVSDHQKIPIAFVQNLVSEEAVQRKKIKVLTKEIHQYIHNNHNKFIYDKHFLDQFVIKAHIGVVSYTLIKELYEYRITPLTQYFEWFNLQSTLYKTVNLVAKNTKRHQFIIIDIPHILPPVTQLRLHSKLNNKTLLRIFPDNKSLNVLDIWRYIDPETRSLSALEQIVGDNINYVDIIFKYNNLFTIMNLEQVLGYSENSGDKNALISVEQLQKMFLKSLLSLHKEYDNIQSLKDKEVLIENEEKIIPDEDNSLDNTSLVLKENQNKLDASVLTDNSDILVDGDNSEIKEALSVLDQDLEEIETYSKMIHSDEDVVQNNTPEKEVVSYATKEESETDLIKQKFINYEKPDDKILNQIEKYKKSGILNNTDYKSNLRSYQKFQEMKNPYGTNQIFNDFISIKPEEIQITAEEKQLVPTTSVIDPRMAQSTMAVMDKKYVKNVMRKDTLAMGKSLMNAGLIIDDYQIDRHDDALGSYENHTIKVKPVIGPSSVIHFKVPVVTEDGEMVLSGKRFYLRKQRQDLPIRKINDREVALTSYFGKTFVTKDEKVVNSLTRWLGTNIRKQMFSDKDDLITKAISSNVFDPRVKVPRLYSALAQQFLRIETNSIVLYLDYHNRNTMLNDKALNELEKDKVFIGYEKKTKYPLFIDFDDNLYVFDNATMKETQSLYDLLGINIQKVPIELVTVNIFSKAIPVVIILGYLMGLDNLMKILNAKHRIIESNKMSKLEKYEYEVKFKDYKLILDRREIKNSLILAGLQKFPDLTKNVYIKHMDDKDVYFDFFKYLGLSSIYIKETDLYNEMFIDPITLGILQDMNEPETFIGLLIRSAEMLVLDDHPSSVDMDYMRIRGYERMPGIVYKELVSSLREYRNRGVISKSQYSLNPYAVWKTINQDPGVSLLSENNPIQNLKQQEAVTFSGIGGRSKDTIVARDRIFNKSDTGVISESTSDSSDAGVNTYMTANPAIKNLRGMKGDFIYDEVGSAGVLSSSATNAIGATNDDPKRVNFTSIQNSHTVGCEKYRQSYVRTGYDSIIPQRTKALYCMTAKKKGKVISINDNGIIVEYEDGEKVGARLGRLYGNHEGSTFPHDIMTPLKVNDKILPGMAICYNQSFFEPDILDPKYVVFKSTLTAKVALMESQYTLEDSSNISKELSEKLRVKTTHTKSIIVNFNQNLLKVHPLSEIKYGDILCYIENEITSNTDIFNEENIETLRALATNAPKSKYEGTLDKVEVYYHGDKEDMSASIRKLADISDKQFSIQGKSSNTTVINGSVNSDYRVDGNPLLLDTAEIKFYITVDHSTGVGDKVVFANQMKSVLGEVFSEPIVSENGDIIDAVFGAQSIANRIVLSPYIMGTTISLLKKIAENAIEIYES